MAARHEEGLHEEHIFIHFLVCKVLLNDDVGVAKGTGCQEMRPGAGFKLADFDKKEKLRVLPQNDALNTCYCGGAPLRF